MGAAKRFILAVGLLTLGLSVAAAPPAWWTNSGTKIVDSQWQPNNFGPVNQGQLKNVATQAKKHLDIALAGFHDAQGITGAGAAVNALVAGFQNNPNTNYAPANLGQLKAVAKVFYDRLNEVGYSKDEIPAGRDPVTAYPWTAATSDDTNYSPANIGQLKRVFSFDLTADCDDNGAGNGLPDWWERHYFGHTGSMSRPLRIAVMV